MTASLLASLSFSLVPFSLVAWVADAPASPPPALLVAGGGAEDSMVSSTAPDATEGSSSTRTKRASETSLLRGWSLFLGGIARAWPGTAEESSRQGEMLASLRAGIDGPPSLPRAELMLYRHTLGMAPPAGRETEA